jgi:hypothetical protein
MLRRRAGVGPARVGSVLRFRLFFRPKRRLNSAGSFMSEVGDHPGPVENAALTVFGMFAYGFLDLSPIISPSKANLPDALFRLDGLLL